MDRQKNQQASVLDTMFNVGKTGGQDLSRWCCTCIKTLWRELHPLWQPPSATHDENIVKTRVFLSFTILFDVYSVVFARRIDINKDCGVCDSLNVFLL